MNSTLPARPCGINLVVGCCLLIIFSACTASTASTAPVACTELFTRFDILEQGQVYTVEDSMQMTEQNGMQYYQVNRYPANTPGVLANVRMANADNSIYFVRKKGTENGLLFDSLHAAGKQLSFHSFLRGRYDFSEAFFYNPADSLTEHHEEGSLLVETYIPSTSTSAADWDSVVLYLCKTNPFPCNYSLAPALEAAKKMKLVKAVLLFNEERDMQTGALLHPRRECRIELREKIMPMSGMELIERAVAMLNSTDSRQAP